MSSFKLVTFDTSITYKNQKKFDCGNEMINSFVHKKLKRRVKKSLSKAFILLDESDNFIAFYTLDTFSITREIFEETQGLPPIIPVIKIGMVGVDKRYQGKGLGKRLLRDAFLKILKISNLAGCKGVYLLAEKDAIAFYEKLGFIKLKEQLPAPMFLDIELIRKSFIPILK
jgi:ribosomal protein S18 acetylase RimI-like enzyme